jgi:hypothetical protein
MATTAAKKRAKSPKARRRSQKRRKPLPPAEFGREQFRAVLRRGKRKLPPVGLDELVESVVWERSAAGRTGELIFRRPLDANGVNLMRSGDVVDLYFRREWDTGAWRRLWRMKVRTPSHQIKEGIMSVAVRPHLDAVTGTKATFKFTSGGKRRKRPWKAHQITQRVCERFHIPMGRIAKGTTPIRKLIVRKATPLAPIEKAYKEEREETGRRFDIDYSSGKLEVLELREPRHMRLLGPAILDAAIDHELGATASAVVVTSTRKEKGSRKRSKLRVRVVNRSRVKRYGYIVKHVEKAGLDSRAAARKYGRKVLARALRPKRDITFTHPGIPTLDRGDAITLVLPEAGIRLLAFVKRVRHSASPGSYDMEVTVGFTNPYRDKRKERSKKKRKQAADRRGRRRERDGDDVPVEQWPKPKKAARRAAA